VVVSVFSGVAGATFAEGWSVFGTGSDFTSVEADEEDDAVGVLVTAVDVATGGLFTTGLATVVG
jgi:hypothetical protein